MPNSQSPKQPSLSHLYIKQRGRVSLEEKHENVIAAVMFKVKFKVKCKYMSKRKILIFKHNGAAFRKKQKQKQNKTKHTQKKNSVITNGVNGPLKT